MHPLPLNRKFSVGLGGRFKGFAHVAPFDVSDDRRRMFLRQTNFAVREERYADFAHVESSVDVRRRRTAVVFGIDAEGDAAMPDSSHRPRLPNVGFLGNRGYQTSAACPIDISS